MSVIIDLLNQSKNITKDKIQERLAETYLLSPGKTKKATHKIKVRFPFFKIKNRNVFVITILSISILSLALLLSHIFSTYTFYENILLSQKITFINGAFKDRGGYITILNNNTKRDVGVAIDFKKPIDLSSKYLLMSAMAKRGEGSLKVILRDKNFRSYTSDVFNIKDAKKGWRNFIIPLNEFKQSINMRNIQHIRLILENKLTREKKQTAELYIKKISLVDR